MKLTKKDIKPGTLLSRIACWKTGSYSVIFLVLKVSSNYSFLTVRCIANKEGYLKNYNYVLETKEILFNSENLFKWEILKGEKND